MRLLVLALLPLLAITAFAFQRPPATAARGTKIGQVDGKDVYSFVLMNRSGLTVKLMSFGATVMAIELPDGKPNPDIVLGYPSLDGYRTKEDPYFGAIVGRYGNRIAKGRFKLEDKEYTLATNNGPNSLHGGKQGFDKRVWDVKDSGGDHVTFHYLSPDGEEGYPGNLNVTVKYTLNDNNELKIEYTATTDKPTVLNITNHTYFNLAGEGSGDVLKQIAYIDADKFTPVNSTLIPNGELKPVAGTPFDFQKPTPIGSRIKDKDQQLEYGRGYDHNFVLNHPGKLRMVARVADPDSKRMVTVSTDQPGLQFYTGNFLDGTITGKSGKPYNSRGAFCLETQHFPDSPNHPSFPSTELKPGQAFRSTTIFRFSSSQ
jgi:aldose 1-epimerase